MSKFIYVFDEQARNKLIAGGYELLKSDEFGSSFVFVNNNNATFSLEDVSYIMSDTLTF